MHDLRSAVLISTRVLGWSRGVSVGLKQAAPRLGMRTGRNSHPV